MFSADFDRPKGNVCELCPAPILQSQLIRTCAGCSTRKVHNHCAVYVLTSPLDSTWWCCSNCRDGRPKRPADPNLSLRTGSTRNRRAPDTYQIVDPRSNNNQAKRKPAARSANAALSEIRSSSPSSSSSTLSPIPDFASDSVKTVATAVHVNGKSLTGRSQPLVSVGFQPLVKNARFEPSTSPALFDKSIVEVDIQEPLMIDPVSKTSKKRGVAEARHT